MNSHFKAIVVRENNGEVSHAIEKNYNRHAFRR